MKILYLGSSTSYVTQNDIGALRSMGHNVSILNPYPDPTIDSGSLVEPKSTIHIPKKNLFRVLLNVGGGFLSPIVLKTLLKKETGDLKDLIIENNIDLIFATWGSNMIPLVSVIQDMNLGIPIVYDFMSYPQNVYHWKVTLENNYCRHTIERIDGRLHASENMYLYFKQKFNLIRGRDIVLPPFFSKRYFFRKRLPLLSDSDGQPHIVFVGPAKLPWDNIGADISQITAEGIHLHMVRPNISIKEGSHLHFFEYFSLNHLDDGSLATFLTQFDACISTFNFNVCSAMDRFWTSYPSRFLFALNSAIPIVIPRGRLNACEKFLAQHNIGFVYDTYKDLKRGLMDCNSMRNYRRNAIEKAEYFTYEQNFGALDKLFRAL
jgi:hypothetical protein